MHRFGPATRAWFESAFAEPTPVQEQGWQQIASGQHALLIAPTGSGKTLAAFLWAIDRLCRQPPTTPGVRTLYVSPLKALVYDVERNLRLPLAGIAAVDASATLPRVAVRTGDTTTKERRQQARHPGEILVTTPESLYLILTSKAREVLRTVDTIIIDEVHALAPTKRGAHLALSLERLCALTATEPQRIGLSATARPTREVARFLGGDRQVAVVDNSQPPSIDLEILVPVPDMTRPQEGMPTPSDDARPGEKGIWAAIHPRLIELIGAHTTTIVFVNSRGLCERLTQRLNELAGEELVRSHHGSLSHGERRVVEEQLKSGELRAIVATSSLELGIDMGAVDLVILVESPGSVASGLQRVGRAGHSVGQISRGRLFPKHRGDLLEAAAVARGMREGAIEELTVPSNPLDVLAQQLVAAVAQEPWQVADLRALVRRAANFQDLPDAAFDSVLDMLSGHYPSNAFAELRPRVVWDRDSDLISPRRGAKMIAIVSGGTIPDRGTYAVYLGEDGPRVGELDEEMVHETTPGQTFTLGATTWRVERVTRDRVLVSAAPGEQGKLPFWHGEGPGRPIELGRAVGALVRKLAGIPTDDAIALLGREHSLDPLAAQNLMAYINEQREQTGALPTDRHITVERFRDELGDWRVCILSPLGSRVHGPWALAIAHKLSAQSGFEVQTIWSDDGIVLRFTGADELPDLESLIPDPAEVEHRVVAQLSSSSIFAGQFRENAARALLMPRQRPGQRTPLWMQRLKSQQLLAIAQEYPSFPIILETYRACLKDIFDMPALISVLEAVGRREITIDPVETRRASPFARSLIFAYVGANLYEGDSPLAERKARALSLDRQMLRELLGAEALRELFDAEVIEAVEHELQRLLPDRAARDPDELHDLLRRIGELDLGEAQLRSDGDAGAWLAELEGAHRAQRIDIGGSERWIAADDAGLYRDALGCKPAPGTPAAFLEPVANPIAELFGRYARTHGPFVLQELADRFALVPGQAAALVSGLERDGALIAGEFRPGGSQREWCDAEVLRRIKRRTLARLRAEVAPIEPDGLARFLPAWHGIGADAPSDGGRQRLQEVLIALEGIALPYSELESVILPARVPDFTPSMIDELGSTGWLVWVGHGALGRRDGRLALYRRDRVSLLLEPPARPEALGKIHGAVLDHLEARGASFFVALTDLCPGASQAELEDALWDLVWAGLITNDTFGPLRALQGKTAKKPVSRRRRASAVRPTLTTTGRWSRVSELITTQPTATEILHARAITLLGRHGVLTRETCAIEEVPGGFSSIYPVLRAMEEAGKLRRGYFVATLGGAQFAFPGAVDRLRAVLKQPAPQAITLAATDPANPYGWLVPWPRRNQEGGSTPRRAAGATLVLYDGHPVIYLDQGGRRAVTFEAALDRDAMVAAGQALRPIAARRRGKWLRIESIDGQPARSSAHAASLREAGFFADHRGLVLETG